MCLCLYKEKIYTCAQKSMNYAYYCICPNISVFKEIKQRWIRNYNINMKKMYEFGSKWYMSLDVDIGVDRDKYLCTQQKHTIKLFTIWPKRKKKWGQ